MNGTLDYPNNNCNNTAMNLLFEKMNIFKAKKNLPRIREIHNLSKYINLCIHFVFFDLTNDFFENL